MSGGVEVQKAMSKSYVNEHPLCNCVRLAVKLSSKANATVSRRLFQNDLYSILQISYFHTKEENNLHSHTEIWQLWPDPTAAADKLGDELGGQNYSLR